MLALSSVKDILSNVSNKVEFPIEMEIEGEVAVRNSNKLPLLMVNVFLRDQDIQFSPDFKKFNEVMEAVISGFVETVVSVPKLISHVCRLQNLIFLA